MSRRGRLTGCSADPAISQYLAKAERESSVESNFSQHESSHFNLHFEGKQSSEGFRRDLLTTLAIFGKLAFPNVNVVGLIGREQMRESKIIEEFQEDLRTLRQMGRL
jgi:hypothetical protein